MTQQYRTISKLLTDGRPNDWPVALRGQMMICWEEFAALMAKCAANLPHHSSTLVLSDEDPLAFLVTMLAGLHSGHRIVVPPNFRPQTLAELAKLQPITASEEPTIELYTSGSTGKPKLITKALRQLEAECQVLQEKWGACIGQRTVVATTPHHHIYGLLFRLLWPLCAGRPFDCTTAAEPATLQNRLSVAGDAILVSSPAQLSRLHALVSLGKLAPHPRIVFSSGGSLLEKDAQRYIDAWGSAPIEIFGSSETGGIAWRQQEPGDNNWTPLPTLKVKQDDDGALIVSSPFLPDETPFRMEDRVSFDQDGRFALLGRLDRIVKIEEKRLSLPEMEEWLTQHPEVAAVTLVVVPSDNRQVIGAVVALHDRSRAQRRAIIESLRLHLEKRFDHILLPRKWRFVDQLPFNERGKLAVSDLLAILENAP